MDAGNLVALNVVLLYTIMGPLVLLALYVLFDGFCQSGDKKQAKKKGFLSKDPAIWSVADIESFLDRY